MIVLAPFREMALLSFGVAPSASDWVFAQTVFGD
jgi:hypothetical protein